MSVTHYVEHKGCQLAYRVQGDGVPVIFIQGTAVHGDGWQPIIDELKKYYTCLSFDNRGMGKSLPLAMPLSVELMAEDAVKLIDNLGWQKAHVVGHSLGGLIALAFALRYPERINSLSLLCTFSRGKDATKLNPWLLQIGMRMRVGTARQRRRAFVDMVMPSLAKDEKDSWAERLAPVFGYDIAKQPKIVNDQLKAMNAFDATPQLSKLKNIPTLVMSAEQDKVAPPRLGKTLAKNLNTPYQEIKGAAHGVTISHESDISELLLKHFKGLKTLPTKSGSTHTPF